MKSIFHTILFLSAVLLGCSNSSKPDDKNQLDSSADIASHFTISKDGDYTILRVHNPWQGAAGIVQTSYLVKKGTALPEGIDSSEVIFVPLRSIICMSVTHVAMVEALGEEDAIKAVSGTSIIYSAKVNEKIMRNEIRDVGYEASLNNELVLDISPDLIMMYGVGHESAGYINKIRDLGVRVLFNADYLETNPLAKAEWIKVFGALFCREQAADSIFEAEKMAYQKISQYVKENIKTRPDVLLGLPYQDTWFISPGNSYMSRLITDAGGNYLWKDTRSEISMPFGIENVYIKAVTADYWFNTGTAVSRREIEAIDHRLTGLPCFKNGHVYNNNRKITGNGGNDYWESGSVHPHLILKDLSAIMHPELFKGYELAFYRIVN